MELQPILEDYFQLNPTINDDKTRYQYRLALKHFCLAIGRPATLGDLNDDNLARMARWLLDTKRAPKTANERCGRIATLWRFLARRGRVSGWPALAKIPEPIRTPVAWLKPELDKLFGTVSRLDGFLGAHPRRDWWRALLLVAWDSGERIGALLEIRWDHISQDWLMVPAEIRKGKRKDTQHRLAPDTLEALAAIRKPARELIFEWPLDKHYIYKAYEQILIRAGLPHDRRSKFHKIRRSVASHYEAAGGNAMRLLGHTSRKTTQGYLDPRIVKTTQAVDLLFRPEAG